MFIELTLLLSASPQAYEDYNWIQNNSNDHWYALSFARGTWHETQDEAERVDSNLVTVRSSTENQFLINNFGLEKYWIGLTDEGGLEGDWEWVSGDTSTYTNWAPGEPNNTTQDLVLTNFNGVPGDWDNEWSFVDDWRGIIELEYSPFKDTDGGGTPDIYEDQNHDGIHDRFETDILDPNDDLLAFYVSGLIPEKTVTFWMRQGPANATVIPLSSIHGSVRTNLGLGVFVDLTAPIVRHPSVDLDQAGNAEWQGGRIPGRVPLGFDVWIQALVIEVVPVLTVTTTRLIHQRVGEN